jgi:hypothetical protein
MYLVEKCTIVLCCTLVSASQWLDALRFPLVYVSLSVDGGTVLM